MQIIKVCCGGTCTLNFSFDTVEKAEKMLGIKAGESTPDGKFRLEKTGCLSHCELGPNVLFMQQNSPLTLIMNDGKVENKMRPRQFEAKLQELLDANSPNNN
ncbi:MAG: NAD(P)H-dependent oxidoreductase subunit E [Patescibacteria group bacterium]